MIIPCMLVRYGNRLEKFEFHTTHVIMSGARAVKCRHAVAYLIIISSEVKINSMHLLTYS